MKNFVATVPVLGTISRPKYPYTLQLTGSENTQTHQVQFITLIEHLILIIN